MINFDHRQAILFRILSSFFGRDQVIPFMSVISVCGGALPAEFPTSQQNGNGHEIDMLSWARRNRCLFTIIDAQSNPRMVVEFFSGFKQVVDVEEAEHQKFLKPILSASGVNYVTFSRDELEEILDPEGTLDFYTLLKSKVEEIGITV